MSGDDDLERQEWRFFLGIVAVLVAGATLIFLMGCATVGSWYDGPLRRDDGSPVVPPTYEEVVE